MENLNVIFFIAGPAILLLVVRRRRKKEQERQLFERSCCFWVGTGCCARTLLAPAVLLVVSLEAALLTANQAKETSNCTGDRADNRGQAYAC